MQGTGSTLGLRLFTPLLLAAALLAAPSGPAGAVPTTDAFSAALVSPAVDLGGFTITDSFWEADDVVLTITGSASWNTGASMSVGYESDHVRQGALLEVSRQASGLPGMLLVTWHLGGSVAGVGTSMDVSGVALCTPSFDPGSYACAVSSLSLSLLYTSGVPLSPWVDLSMTAAFTITAEGLVTSRSFAIDGVALPPDPVELSMGSAPEAEGLPVPCDRPAGRAVTYALDPLGWTPAVEVTQQAHLTWGLTDPFVGIGKVEAGSKNFGPAVSSSVTFDLAGPGHTTAMGALLPNDSAPTIAAFPGFSGAEGRPVQFSASIASACPIDTYVWQFSDGTTSYGPAPERAFGNDALYSGQLTVSDITNLEGTRSFWVDVANVLPVAAAGPDTSGLWGVPVAFNGQAVDPGWVDQATLVYSWNWGDGTPGTGGASARHVYAAPGPYVALLEVCDDHGCVNDAADVTVFKRATTVAYTGHTPATFSSTTTLSASLVDELGVPVSGAAIAFLVNGAPAGSAQTGPTGGALLTIPVALPAGSYPVSAVFAATSLYRDAFSNGSLGVARMPSTLVYTGALKGGPNKIVSLSAYLVDELGRPLGGKVVTFVLGMQQVQATTEANGVATASLKLAQKNGKYPLTASWVPAGTDAARYTGAAASRTFSIQAK